MTPLILSAEVQELTDATILDVRWQLSTGPDRETYLEGHVPGAVFVDLDPDLADPPGAGGRHPLPAPGRFVSLMRAAGVFNDAPVVVYDDAFGVPAARAWWLRHYGHGNVRLLDGGLAAWRAAGGAIETGTPDVVPGDFDGTPGTMRVVGADQIPGYTGTLVDVRTTERFRGEREPIDPVTGHIPGATNVPAGNVLTADGTMRPAHELRAVFAGCCGDVAAYCGSGVTAAQAVVALEVAGIDAALYPGSWSEWITDPSRPIATGE